MFGAFISGGMFEDMWDVWDVEEDGLDIRLVRCYEGYERVLHKAALATKALGYVWRGDEGGS